MSSCSIFSLFNATLLFILIQSNFSFENNDMIIRSCLDIENTHTIYNSQDPNISINLDVHNSTIQNINENEVLYTCSICHFDYKKIDSIQFCSPSIGQPHFLCITCLHNYLKNSVSRSVTDNIKCPMCNREYTEDMVIEPINPYYSTVIA